MKKEYLNEIWKPIKGYEGLYEVSNLGRVKNIKSNRILKLYKDKRKGKEYLRVCLYKNKKSKKYYVHRLVAEAFLPNPYKLPQVNHKDENKTNNNVDNLEWCTNEYNHNYGTINERISKSQINHPLKSYPVDIYDLDMNFIETLPSSMEVERKYKIPHSHVSICCNGGVWVKNHTKWYNKKRVKQYICKWHKNK